MKQSLSLLRPNPGWINVDSNEANELIPSSSAEMVGKHCILELYECDQIKLNNEAFLRMVIATAAKHAGAKLLHLITHRFEPHGVTGLALLAESHISIHTWPENAYAAVDVFTCGDHTMPQQACEFICKELEAGSYSLKTLDRNTPEDIRNSTRIPVSENSLTSQSFEK